MPIEIKTNIRPAVPADAEAIAELFMTVWHTSLKDMVPREFLNQFSQVTQKKKYIDRTKDQNWIFLIAEYNGQIVGMISATNGCPESPYQKEIRGMYVHPNFQRNNIGTQLLHSLFAQLKDKNVKDAMLWCIKSNKQACSFYEKHGGIKIENIPPPEEYSIVPHVIYSWKF